MAAVLVRSRLVVLLLGLRVRPADTDGSRVSTLDDLLLPYTHHHGPPHSHRYIRDCQSVAHGNLTYEVWPSSTGGGPPQTRVFVTDIPGSSKWVYGHMTVVPDPLRMVSVLEPGGPGGCGEPRGATVEETARAAGCVYAQNGGFFNTESYRCLGNVVSDGRLVQDSGGLQNVQFGIRKDGQLVTGYLSQEDVLQRSNPWVQLLSGVVWLLRAGEVYVQQSLVAECDHTQETEFQTFINAPSGRTAVGHDAAGRLVLVQTDGQTGVRGMNLWQLAAYLKANGVVNAINLDGGGSSTAIINGSLASYPSDHCADARWRCARRVSTVLCVHPRRCPLDCSGNGGCVEGVCQCRGNWRGPACSTLDCRAPPCGPHGVCTNDGCVCDAGWRGDACSQRCLPGFYGDGCKQRCVCVNGGRCDPIGGRCSCPAGFHGYACEQACLPGFFGPSCAQECRCDDRCPCDPQTGSCNATLDADGNSTLQTVGHCVAVQLFSSWRREAAVNLPHPLLTERSWLLLTVALASLLVLSLLGHMVWACPRPPAAQGHGYAHIPLIDTHQPTWVGWGARLGEESGSEEELYPSQ
ncbi:N-acetylglucosamine-1-phosphodiester alpha-N-acetylglucosaminidase [Antennarius striatus]|uniref:N-acetylglucosamine-1-phosphodiester alpha-N-acetylglucosaminidase n=1 Tax=Antennarius striatus TaxID=241820 RepID=UPI0035B0A7B6